VADLHSDPSAFFARIAGKGARVLLINPPVQEKRYHWIRWNQPLELLRLSTWLKTRAKDLDVRLFDFMAPAPDGTVPKHRVKERWQGAEEAIIWHFGQPFEEFERRLLQWRREAWNPDVIVVSSLCSYWHVAIGKLLSQLCTKLGPQQRRRTKICLYGNYPRIEPEHARRQAAADVALTTTVDTTGCAPDFELHFKAMGHLPNFFAFDIEDPAVVEHIDRAVALARRVATRPGVSFRGAVGAFFNADLCSPSTRLADVAVYLEKNPGTLRFEAICGVEPSSVTRDHLDLMRRANFRSLFVEHARLGGGSLAHAAYAAIRDELREQTHAKRVGRVSSVWCAPTGFVKIGLPGDDLDELVEAALELNSWFQSIILKPYGYSPSIDEEPRETRWHAPHVSSPQWFPYVGHGSSLTAGDYDNLVRFQNMLNRRVKGTTFDFLGDGNVAQLVRETLIGETWKRRSVEA
jgi:hypothetical protein